MRHTCMTIFPVWDYKKMMTYIYGTGKKLTVCKMMWVRIWARAIHVRDFFLYGYHHMPVHMYEHILSA